MVVYLHVHSMKSFHHKTSDPMVEPGMNYTYFTCDMVLTSAVVWRSTCTTLGWPLLDAIIRGVAPSCEGRWRENYNHEANLQTRTKVKI